MIRANMRSASKPKRAASRAAFFALLCTLCGICIIVDFLGILNMTPGSNSTEYLALEFNDCTVTELSRSRFSLRFRSVFLIDDGKTKSVLKVYPNADHFEHSLRIQRIIEHSEFKDIAVSMLDFNREDNWIRFEAGIPIERGEESKEAFFRDIPDWKEQIMRIHTALSSLGIVHNDVHPTHFLLSQSEPTKMIMFDFGNSVMPKEIPWWFNRRHLELVLFREYRLWLGVNKGRESFVHDKPEFERAITIFPKWFDKSPNQREQIVAG